MKFCANCGKELADMAAFCPDCGYPSEPVPVASVSTADQRNLLTKLSERLKINGIIWIVIAVIQILIGLFGGIWVLIVGVLNIVSAVKDMNYSKTVLENPEGVVANFEPLTSPIITLAYNLIAGGLIGVAGSVYYFSALRGFVMENKDAFLAIERAEMTKNA